MQPLPVTHSIICSDALLKNIIPQFQIESPKHCLFWCQGLNDTYKITTANEVFILRVYRHLWRTPEQIHFEIDALLHLQNNGCNVAYPILTHTGEYIVKLEAPEGVRYTILTRYIAGKELDLSDLKTVHLYGSYVAQLHLNSAQFNSSFQRPKLDVQHLITEPLARIKPFLKNRQDDWSFIESYAQQLALRLQKALNDKQALSFCHGDLHAGNAHMDAEQLGLFDFDCCALGLRSYDLAVFKWSLKVENKDLTIWETFLQSYQQQFPLPADELLLIDTLVSIRQIWLVGLHIEIALAKGWLDENYFTHKITFLREQLLLENSLDI